MFDQKSLSLSLAGHSRTCLQNLSVALAESKTHVSLSVSQVALIIEGRAGNADDSILMSELISEGVVLGSLVSIAVHRVFFLDLYPGNIGKHEMASLGNPYIKVKA